MSHFVIPKAFSFFNNILIFQIISVSNYNWQLFQDLVSATAYKIVNLFDTIVFDINILLWHTWLSYQIYQSIVRARYQSNWHNIFLGKHPKCTNWPLDLYTCNNKCKHLLNYQWISIALLPFFSAYYLWSIVYASNFCFSICNIIHDSSSLNTISLQA